MRFRIVLYVVFLIYPQLSSAAPALRSVKPASAVQGDTLNLTITGDGFISTSTNLTFSGTGVLVNGVRVTDSSTLVANVTLLSDPGTQSISFTNGSGSSSVLFEILPGPLANPQNGIVTRLNGPAGGSGSNDGRGTEARFINPSGVWSDGVSLFVTDQGAYTIRKISIATGEGTTLAGAPQQSGYVDGVGPNARFLRPTAIWGDGANLYVGDNGSMIRKIVIATGEVSTFVGVPTPSRAVDGPREQVRLSVFDKLWGDGTYLYVTNGAVLDRRGGAIFTVVSPATIRAISIATGDAHSIQIPQIPEAAGGIASAISYILPQGLWTLNGYLYTTWFSPGGSLSLGRINLTTEQFEPLFNFNLHGPFDFIPDPAFNPAGFWFDGIGSFYFLEGSTVRRIDLSTGQISSVVTVPGSTNSTSSTQRSLWGVGNSLFVTDFDSSAVIRVEIPAEQATIFAGLPSNAPLPNALNSAFPGQVLWVDGTYAYVQSGTTIQKYDLSGNPSTVAARDVSLISGMWLDDTGIYGVSSDKSLHWIVPSTLQQSIIAAGFSNPDGIWGNATYVYITDTDLIRRVNKATGENVIFAGSTGPADAIDGVGVQARFRTPRGIWGDDTYLYVADSGNHSIRRIRLDTAEVTTLAGNFQQASLVNGNGAAARFYAPTGIWGDGANLYVTDSLNGTTRKIVAATADVTTLSNSSETDIWGAGSFLYESTFTSLRRVTIATGAVHQLQPQLVFSEGVMPADSFQVKVSWGDGEYLYGASGYAIYRTRISTGVIEHLAGAFNASGVLDGIGNDARFFHPAGIWGDGTFLYVADYANIRRVNPATREVTTLATGFQSTTDIWGDATYLYVIDNVTAATLERITIATGQVTRLAGTPQAGDAVDGIGTAGHFRNAVSIWGNGTNLYIGDACAVRKFNPVTSELTTFAGSLDTVNGCRQVDGARDLARFKGVGEIWGNGRLLFVASSSTIRTIDLGSGEVRTIAGNPNLIGSIDGPVSEALFRGPTGIWSNGETLFIADSGVREISFQTAVPAYSVSLAGANHLRTTAGTGALTLGYGRIHAASGSVTPNGVAVFSYRSNGVLVSETAVPATRPIQAGRIYAENAGAVRTGVAIANPNDVSASISFYFTDENGANFGSGTTAIPANQQIARFLDEAPFNGSSAARSFTFTSSLPVGAIALHGYTNERSDFLMTTLPVAPIVAASGASVVLPHFAAGGGWTTQVLLVNPSDSTMRGIVNMEAAYSYTIPPRSAAKIVSSISGSQILTGIITVVPGAGTATPVASTVFSFVSGGVTVTESGVATTGIAQAFDIFAEFDSVQSMQTGVAVANTSSIPADVQFALLDMDGRATPYNGSATIPANGHLALFLHELPGFANLPSTLQGVLRISSSAPISAIGLRERYNERGDFLISTMPALPENAPTTTDEFLFPHIVTGAGYTTEFVLMSPGTSSDGAIVLRSQAGTDLPLPLIAAPR